MRLLSILLLILLPSVSSAWWNDQWSYRMPVGMDSSISGASLSESITDGQVLVRLHAGNFQDFFLLKEDLGDIRFVAADDTTPLKHHVESFDLINQLIFIWVKVPQLTAGVNTERLWMYYGKEDAVSADDSGGVYDINEAIVLQFKDEATLLKDSTANNSGAIQTNLTYNKAALIAGGAVFSGESNIIVNDTPNLRVMPTQGATFSAWIKPTQPQTKAILFSRSSEGVSFEVRIEQATVVSELTYANGVKVSVDAANAIVENSWQNVGITLSATEMVLYVNGSERARKAIQLPELSGNLLIGGLADGSQGFVGEMDEVHYAKATRSAGHFQLIVKNQGPQDYLLRPQPAEQLGDAGGSSGGFFSVIFTSTGESGWTIILLLGIMALISWMVMIGKWIYLRHAVRDNEDFLAQYNKMGNEDPAMLDVDETEDEEELADSPITQAIFGKHDHFQSSPIYHLYHRGIQEVHARLGKSVGAKAAGLSPTAVEAIKASLDAAMIREIQRLNGQMVLLTIAISGGPFLGLLGTVVGVMITFAAIAATGDVNIAAIAPGVAAALLTTVAGLFVAIPALFGYNYLMSRVKSVVADMRVFIDEYTTKIAEYYGS